MPTHIWIHPWLPIIGTRLECLWMPIRFKLSACLERWDPRDRSAREVLRPWHSVLDPANWEPLIEKVLCRLESAVADAAVQPGGQDTGPVENLLAWLGVAPTSSVASVLERALFPRWHVALREWFRSPGADFKEVVEWYQGWRALLPEEVREQGSVQRQLAHGLEVMKHFMSDSSEGGGAQPPSTAPAPAAPPPPAAVPRAPAGRGCEQDVALSLCDYLAEVAGEQGLLFRPKAR